jgi:PqqD family protein of HPr-rel-A system
MNYKAPARDRPLVWLNDPMPPRTLIPRPDLETVDLDEELLVFDPVQETSHIFNRTAAEIWRLLGGRVPVAGLAAELEKRYQLPSREEVERLVEKTLVQLRRLGLVIPGEDLSSTPKGSERPEALPPRAPDEVETLFLEAGRFLREGQTEQAERVLEPLPALGPESPAGFSNRGVRAILLDRWTEAEEALERARDLDPSNPEVAFNLSSLRFFQGRPEEALTLLNPVERDDPDNVHVLSLAGRILTALNRLDEARERLDRALSLDPGYINLYQELALVYLLQDRLAEAEERLHAGLRLSAAHPYSYSLLGHLQFKRRDLEGALQRYRQAQALNPGDWLTGFNVAVVHFHQGQWDSAVAEVERCLGIHPAYLPAYELLARAHQAQGERGKAFLVYLRAKSRAADFPPEAFPALNALARAAAGRTGGAP